MPKKKQSLSIQPYVIVSIVVILLLAVGVYWQTAATKKIATSQATVSPTSSAQSPEAMPSASPVVASDVTWLKEPQKLAGDLHLLSGLFERGSYPQDPEVTYYRLGQDHSQDVILAIVPAADPSGDHYAVFVKTATGYDLLLQHTDMYQDGQWTYLQPPFPKQIHVDPTKAYDGITPPTQLEFKGMVLEKALDPGNILFSDYGYSVNYPTQKLAVYGQTAYGQLYTLTRYADPGKQPIQTFVLHLPSGLAQMYRFDPKFLTNDSVPQITWLDGKTNKDSYRYDDMGGCGSPGFVSILQPNELANLKPAGTTNTGEQVYDFKDPAHSVAKARYDELGGTYYHYDEKTGESQNIPISFAEYIAKHGVFVYKDALDRYIVFTNTVYGLAAECGKPVIYLYPTKTTDVSVKVDAHITKSEPVYDHGWRVTAQPDGKLTTKAGEQYGSLFWEGTGHDYPMVDQGVVVAQADVVPTLIKQLQQLGLNQPEMADFLAFWQPKLPTTPYVRLTWLGTTQMNQLAPLTITPRPDTLIRLFLEFEGLQQPQTLVPQVLGAPARRGFTVVEWGGLLRR